MSLFQWHAKYSVKNGFIDGQHQGLFRTANDLHSAMMSGAGKAVVGKALKDLVEYTQSHFRDEEALMRKTNYPQYPSHKIEHDQFTKRVLALRQEFDGGRITITIETLSVIQNWLEKHIIGRDTLIGEHVARTVVGQGPVLVSPRLRA